MLRNGVSVEVHGSRVIRVLPSPTLSLYVASPLFSQDVLEYKKKQRPQKIKMLDGAIKTIMVDDSKTVGELLVTICSRIGIELYEITSETGEILFFFQSGIPLFDHARGDRCSGIFMRA